MNKYEHLNLGKREQLFALRHKKDCRLVRLSKLCFGITIAFIESIKRTVYITKTY